ncbi:MAG TPA: recombinase family protein, partial [Rhodospirillales bacterium]|nr:recombinase family protein [Rhodospirillales bacterium]
MQSFLTVVTHADRLRPGLKVRPLTDAIAVARRLAGRRCRTRAIHEELAASRSDTRPGLAACLKALQLGNTLVLWKLDKLGRDLRHLRRHGGGPACAGCWAESKPS